MSRIASADTARADSKGGFAVAEQTCPAPGFANAVTAAPKDLQGFLMFLGNLSIRKAGAATRERVAHLVNSGLESAGSDARCKDSIDPKGDAAMRFARAVREAEHEGAVVEIAAMKAVGWIDEEIAEIVLHVAMSAMLNTLDRLGEANLPGVAPRICAA